MRRLMSWVFAMGLSRFGLDQDQGRDRIEIAGVDGHQKNRRRCDQNLVDFTIGDLEQLFQEQLVSLAEDIAEYQAVRKGKAVVTNPSP